MGTDPFAKLSGFSPKQAPEPGATDASPPANKEAVRELARSHGFGAEATPPAERRYFRRPGARSVPMANAAIRVELNDWNRFQEFCERNRFTVKEGFKELLRRALGDGSAA